MLPRLLYNKSFNFFMNLYINGVESFSRRFNLYYLLNFYLLMNK